MKKLLLVVTVAAVAAAVSTRAQTKNVEVTIDGVAGFQDTPMQPDGKWHVHDPARPQPPMVTPGTFSENAKPPADATVLFDGQDVSEWTDKQGNPAPSALSRPFISSQAIPAHSSVVMPFQRWLV